MMKPKEMLILSIVLAVVFSSIYIIYTIPQEKRLGGEWYPSEHATKPTTNPKIIKNFSEIQSRLYASIIVYFMIGGLTAYLSFGAYRASKLWGELRKESLQHLSIYFGLTGTAAFIQAIGITKFVLDGFSETRVDIFGYTVNVYPLSIPIATAVVTLSIMFIPLFGFIMSEKRYPPLLVEGILIGLVIVELLTLVPPQNWFGCYVPYSNGKPVDLDIRPLSALILLVVFLYGTLVTSLKIYKRVRITEDHITRFRLKLLIISFLLIDAYFIFYMIDSMIGGGFTVFMLFGVISAILAFIGIYLSVISPDWLIDRLKARYGESS